jgi:hypothetical protein
MEDVASHIDGRRSLLDRPTAYGKYAALVELLGTGEDDGYRAARVTRSAPTSQRYVFTNRPPNAAQIRVADPRYRASRVSSASRAVTPRTGIP